MKQQECNEGQVCVPHGSLRQERHTLLPSRRASDDTFAPRPVTGDGGSPVPSVGLHSPAEQPWAHDGRREPRCLHEMPISRARAGARRERTGIAIPPVSVCAKGKAVHASGDAEGRRQAVRLESHRRAGCSGRCFQLTSMKTGGGPPALERTDVCDGKRSCASHVKVPEGGECPGGVPSPRMQMTCWSRSSDLVPPRVVVGGDCGPCGRLLFDQRGSAEIRVTQRPLRETITCDSSFVASIRRAEALR